MDEFFGVEAQGGVQLPGAALVPSDHLGLDAVLGYTAKPPARMEDGKRWDNSGEIFGKSRVTGGFKRSHRIHV